MGMNYIDAGMLKNAFLAGAKGLEANKEWINELNVFPVPDGDTGTNMTMTILSAAREVAAAGEGDFLRFPAWRTRQFRRYPFTALPRIYERD